MGRAISPQDAVARISGAHGTSARPVQVNVQNRGLGVAELGAKSPNHRHDERNWFHESFLDRAIPISVEGLLTNKVDNLLTLISNRRAFRNFKVPFFRSQTRRKTLPFNDLKHNREISLGLSYFSPPASKLSS